MKIALIQFDIIPGDILYNEATVEKLVEQCAAQKVDAVVLPELWNCGYDLKNLEKNAQTITGSSVKLMARLAKKFGMYIFGGSIAEKKAGKYYNTMFVFNEKGDIIEKYRKIHLFPLVLEEQKYFEAGDEWGMVDTPWGKFGLMLCYDLRFTELARNLALRGAKALIIPAQWPKPRIGHWHTLNVARAIENQLFIFATNRTGKDLSGKYVGCSMIVDPLGEVLAGGLEAKDAGIIIADCDFSQIEDIRRSIPVYNDRANLLDEIDNSLL